MYVCIVVVYLDFVGLVVVIDWLMAPESKRSHERIRLACHERPQHHVPLLASFVGMDSSVLFRLSVRLTYGIRNTKQLVVFGSQDSYHDSIETGFERNENIQTN